MGQVDSESLESADAARDFQDRLGRFAQGLFAIAGVMLVASWVVTALPGTSTYGLASHVSHVVALLLIAGVWWLCRGTPRPRPVLDTVDALLAIALGIAWVTLGFGAPLHEPIEFSVLLASTYTVIARAVVVPSTFARTLAVSALVMAPTVVFLFVRGMPFVSAATAESKQVFLLFATLWCLIGVATAALISRRIYGLRERIRAMRRLGQYTLAEKIGEGGMGAVYRAHHSMLRRPAAIKLLLPTLARDIDLARFEREVQLTSQLSHPNTISIFDYGRSEAGEFYYVMELLDGLDLERLVAEDGPLPAPRVVHILAQVCGSLSEAHALGLIHRDIKPANIILTARADEPDVVKVVDFGLVRPIEDRGADANVTRAGTITGTPLYLAPEAITDPGSIDARVDLYAVGAAGYYLLTGKHVFEGASFLAVCSKHVAEEPVPPSVRLGAPIAADLEQLILSCLAKRRDDRPASAAVLRASLLACADARAFDAAAARLWWSARRARVTTLTPDQAGRAPTVAIQLDGRQPS